MTKKIELPENLVLEIERRAALEGKNVDDTLASVVREGLDSLARARPAPIVVDAAMLEERKRLLDKFLTGEWSVDFEGFEEAQAKERAEAEEQMRMWSE